MAELRLKIDRPDVVLRPNVEQFGLLDSVDPRELIQAGEKSVEDKLPVMRKQLDWRKQLSRKFYHPTPPGVPISEMLIAANQEDTL